MTFWLNDKTLKFSSFFDAHNKHRDSKVAANLLFIMPSWLFRNKNVNIYLKLDLIFKSVNHNKNVLKHIRNLIIEFSFLSLRSFFQVILSGSGRWNVSRHVQEENRLSQRRTSGRKRSLNRHRINRFGDWKQTDTRITRVRLGSAGVSHNCASTCNSVSQPVNRSVTMF